VERTETDDRRVAAGQPINARRHDMKFITETIGFAAVLAVILFFLIASGG
jgi:hypothetical protein